MKLYHKVFAIAAVAALNMGYAAAEPQGPVVATQALESVFPHSRDAREFRYQQEVAVPPAVTVKKAAPVILKERSMKARSQIFRHSRDARERRYMRQAKDVAGADAKVPGYIFKHSRDAREFRYQYQR